MKGRPHQGNRVRLDFSQLYIQLGVEPGCSLEDFRRAYRRRISVLHPDRNALPAETDLASELNVLYESALDFHKRFGRLPGAAPSPAAVETAAANRIHPTPAAITRVASPALEDERPSRYRRLVWLLVILLIIGSMLWDSFAWRWGL